MGGSTAGSKLEIARGSDSADRDPEKAEPHRSNSTLPIHKDINLKSYRQGYPRVSVTIGETPEYQTFRRFRRARVRLILAKQDRVSSIEERLDEVDQQEKAELFLGSMRRDKNHARKVLLSDLDEALADYDQLLQRSDWVFNARHPRPDALKVVKDWRNEEGSIARAESSYLDCHRLELLNIGDRKHLTYTRLERQIERFFELLISSKNRMFAKFGVEDPGPIRVHTRLVREITRVLIAVLAILLLLAPIVALNATEHTLPRFVIIFVTSSIFVMTISILSMASVSEIFAAGAAYAAVMVVFVSGNGIQSTK